MTEERMSKPEDKSAGSFHPKERKRNKAEDKRIELERPVGQCHVIQIHRVGVLEGEKRDGYRGRKM